MCKLNKSLTSHIFFHYQLSTIKTFAISLGGEVTSKRVEDASPSVKAIKNDSGKYYFLVICF